MIARLILLLVTTAACYPLRPIVLVEPMACRCACEAKPCDRADAAATKKAVAAAAKADKAEETVVKDKLREETGRAKQQVESMKGVAEKAAASATPNEGGESRDR